MDPYVQARERMVAHDLAARGIRDHAVLAAMRAVPRHRFVTAVNQPLAYADEALSLSEGQTISQPYIVALMLQEARLTPDDVVLEVGTGSGYAAAVAAQLAARVYTVERRPALAARAREALAPWGNVDVRLGDGSRGWPEAAPFDAILVAAAGPEVPRPLLQQLAIGGRLVMPVGDDDDQRLVRVVRVSADRYDLQQLIPVRFVPLVEDVLG